ncbi:MAG: hypothetical protein QE487_03425 [Fluviicola sp.]|nr:hypothetical protein [Fluviicola sp.]
MKRLILTGMVALTLSYQSSAQFSQTVTSSIGSNLANQNAGGTEITTNGVNGDIISTGYFSGTADFDPSSGSTVNLTAGANGSGYVQRLTNNGVYIWAVSIPSISTRSVIVGENGNCLYITGSYTGTVDFNPNPSSTANLTSVGGNDIFVLKLSITDGSFIWAKSFGGSGDDVGVCTTMLAGVPFVTGHFTGTSDFNPNSGTTNLTSFGGTDVFVMKLSVSGNLAFVKQVGGTGDDNATQIITPVGGNGVVLTGTYNLSADLDPSSVVQNVTCQSIGSFCLNLSALGNYVWATNISTSDWGQAYVYDVVEYASNYYLCGSYIGNMVVYTASGKAIGGTPNNLDAGFVLKLDQNGFGVWFKLLDNPVGTPQSGCLPSSIGANYSGDLYITGRNLVTTDFDPGAGVFTLTGIDYETFVTRWTTDGVFQWAYSLENTRGIPKITATSHGGYSQFYLTGGFVNTQDFDFTGGTNTRVSTGSQDAFSAKWQEID